MCNNNDSVFIFFFNLFPYYSTYRYDESLAVPCQELCDKWSASSDSDLSQFSANDITMLTSNQIRIFLYKVLLLEVNNFLTSILSFRIFFLANFILPLVFHGNFGRVHILTINVFWKIAQKIILVLVSNSAGQVATIYCLIDKTTLNSQLLNEISYRNWACIVCTCT